MDEDERNEWLSRRDRIANLQLLEGKRNQSKSDRPILDWFGDLPKHEAIAFQTAHYFPPEVTMDFTNFRMFYEVRRSLMKTKLRGIMKLPLPAATGFPKSC